MKESNRFECTEVNQRIIITWILKKLNGVDWIDLA
jgi:hypothetical protein